MFIMMPCLRRPDPSGGAAAKPYAFSCLAAAPSTCVKVVSEGGGIWCCPEL